MTRLVRADSPSCVPLASSTAWPPGWRSSRSSPWSLSASPPAPRATRRCRPAACPCSSLARWRWCLGAAARDPGHGRGVPPPDCHPDLPGHPDRGRVVAAKLVAYPWPGSPWPWPPGVTAAVGAGWLAANGMTPSLLDARLGRVVGVAVLGAGLCGWSGWVSVSWSATRSRRWSAPWSGCWWSRACSWVW